MSWLIDLGLFALLFFILVFVHEFGHFLMARLVGIRVEKFSIGMGPSLFAFKRGDTEYRLAALPLGGYVKMAGDDPTKEYSEEEKKVGFLTQKPGAKLLVVFGGPSFNLILPIFVYAFMLILGIPTVENIIGSVEPGQPAFEAGLQPGDRILKLKNIDIKEWNQVEEIVRNSANEELPALVERRNLQTGELERLEMVLKPELGEGRSRFGESIQVGKLGISPSYIIPQIYFEDSQSPVAQAGFKKFDRVLEVAGVPVRTMSEFRKALAVNEKLQDLPIKVTRDGLEFSAIVKVPSGTEPITARLGLYPIELVIGKIEEGSPAARAGIQVGDRLVSINGKVLTAWEQVPEIIRGSAGRALEVVWSRDGQRMSASLQAEKTTIDDPILGKDNPLAVNEIYRIGVTPRFEMEMSLFQEKSYNPIMWVKKGVTESWNLMSMTVTALTKLVTGDLSLKLLGSPIMIYKVAGSTFRLAGGGHHGWIAFLTNLALLSITLGLVNLLPIPVLDGGHALFFIIEAIRGKPVSIRVMEIATQIGIFVLVAIFALVIYNDLDRYNLLGRLFQVFK